MKKPFVCRLMLGAAVSVFVIASVFCLPGIVVSDDSEPDVPTDTDKQLRKPALGTVNFEPLSQLLHDISSRMGKGVAMVLVKNNKIIYEKYCGDIKADTVIPIASATKWITTIVIMDLVEEGLLTLDTPASHYVPALHQDAVKGKHILDHHKDNILVRHLLSLQTGLTREGGHQEPTLKAQATALGSADMENPPGTLVDYASAGFEMAGYLAESVTGKPWKEIFEARLKNPLQLSTMQYCAAPRQMLCDHKNPRLSGGIVSNLRDYTKIIAMLLNKGVYVDFTNSTETRILDASSVDLMFTDHGAGIAKGKFFNLAKGDHDGYGFGTWIKSKNGVGSQPAIVSDPGAFGMYPFIDLEKKFAGIYFVFDRLNRQWENIFKARDMARDLL
jgi:CubicO group peptidase (beta-lactamase class C family)